MIYYKLLVPELRSKILDGIKSQMSELDSCYPTAFVSAEKERLKVLEIILKTLPDGYPLPFERNKE